MSYTFSIRTGISAITHSKSNINMWHVIMFNACACVTKHYSPSVWENPSAVTFHWISTPRRARTGHTPNMTQVNQHTGFFGATCKRRHKLGGGGRVYFAYSEAAHNNLLFTKTAKYIWIFFLSRLWTKHLQSWTSSWQSIELTIIRKCGSFGKWLLIYCA